MCDDSDVCPTSRILEQNSALDCTGCHSRNNLPLEENVHDERRNRDDNHIGEEQVPLCVELAPEAKQSELGRDVFVARQKVEWQGEIVIDDNG